MRNSPQRLTRRRLLAVAGLTGAGAAVGGLGVRGQRADGDDGGLDSSAPR
jgi:hypothetical protein